MLNEAPDSGRSVQEQTTSAADGVRSSGALLEALPSGAARGGDPGGRNARVPTGFAELDQLFAGGLWRGHLTVVGGRAGMGTSTFALDLARSAARARLPTLVMCTDTSTDELMFRLLAAEASVPLSRLRNGTASTEDQSRHREAGRRLAATPLYLNTTPTLTVEGVDAAVQAAHTASLSLLVIDGLQTLIPVRPRETPYYEVSESVHQLKRLARHHNLPVVVTSKLNRAPEYRTGSLPMLHDLRNAGDIEDVADEVVLLHRPDAYDPESERAGEADIIVAKNRHGTTRTITVAFQGHYSRFTDMFH